MKRSIAAAGGVGLAVVGVGAALLASGGNNSGGQSSRISGHPMIAVPSDATSIDQYPKENVSLAPLSAAQRQGLPATQPDPSTIIDDAAAGPHPLSGDDPGSPTVEIVSYSNSQHGSIQPDGSVKLDYQNVPAYVVTWPLTHEIFNMQPIIRPSSTTKASATPRSCSFVSVVSTKGVIVEAFEDCA